MNKTIVNVVTGEVSVVEMTAEEIAQQEIVVEVTREFQEANRASAYRSEADPLFFKAQRGEATTDEWTAKVAEIKARFPYPGGDQ